MPKYEYLMKAHTLDLAKDNIGGYFWSEKLDGTRCFWDGGISRGILTSEVPYANTVKDGRYVEEPIATGLWSLSGKPIQAPDWFLDKLPELTMLDGELWAGNGRFQEVRKVVSGLPGRSGWENIKYMVFDLPSVAEILKPREIKIRNEYSFFVSKDAFDWAYDRGIKLVYDEKPFEIRAMILESFPNLSVVKNERLPLSNQLAKEALERIMVKVLERGGEGVILRWGPSKYEVKRSHYILKYKPWFTSEGNVCGYFAGEEGKTGQLLGKIGAVLLDLDGNGFLKLSGFTHQEREILDPETKAWAEDNPGKLIPHGYEHHIFKLMDRVEFKYRELSDDNIPKEARYFRVRD
jgi:ATP-dependent DNA ligase